MLLITNYSSVYLSICLFISFIYLLNYTPSGRSVFTKEYLAWLKATPKLGRPILSGSIFISLEVTQQVTRQKILPKSGGIVAHKLFTLACKIQKALPVVVAKSREKHQTILVSSGGVAVVTIAYVHNILLNLRDPFLVGAFLPRWR